MDMILEQGKYLNLVIPNGANNFTPLLMLGTAAYDPYNFSAVGGSPKRKELAPSYRDEVPELLRKGKEAWEKMRSSQPTGNTADCKQIEFPGMGSGASSWLEMLVSEAVGRTAVSGVVNEAKPLLDKFIADTYGTLPQKLEVTGPKGRNTVMGVIHEKFDTVLKIVDQDIPVFLTGPAGSGKNVICKQVSEALGLEFYFSNAVTQEFKLTGFIDAYGHYQETQFYKAFTNGGLFMLDEIDASTPEVLVILNAAIANKYFDFPTGKVTAHEDFRIVAGGNTLGTGADIEYTGRYQLDAASLDRFAIVEIGYSEAIENALAENNTELVKFVRDFRRAVGEANIKFVVSYRAVERLHKLEQVFEKGEAIKIALLKGLEKEDARQICGLLNSNTSYEEEVKKVVA
jgi:MoxR-like ATPase